MESRATRVLTGLVVLSTCLVLALTLVIARHVDRATDAQSDRVSWRESIVGMAFGLERQYLLLRGDLCAALQAGGDTPTVDLDTVRDRYELFMSRVALLRSSPVVLRLQNEPQQAALTARLDVVVARGEALFHQQAPSRAEANHLLDLLDEAGPAVQAYTMAASMLTTHTMETQFSAIQQQALLIGGLAGAQLLLIGLMLHAARSSRRRESRARQALQALNDQLQDAKLQAESAARTKSQFLANMSHELRTPFQGVIGMLQILRGTPLTAQQTDVVHAATASARHLLQVLNEVLDVSAIEAGRMTLRPVAFELARLCAEVESLARLHAETKGLALHMELDPALPEHLHGDPMRIKQILFNLLNNAVKFTPAGTVNLSVRSLGVDAGHAMLEFEVRDTGIGIEPAALERLFQRFETGDGSLARRHGGAGLGLEISRTLARLMGGDLVATSRPRKGSTFLLTLRLPLAADEAARAESEWAELLPAADGRRMKVLVADDHPINRQYLQLVLQGLGHVPTLVDNGEEAVEVVQTDRFDAVLMDVHMPVLDGLEATRRIRALRGSYAGLPVVALSADVVGGAQERARDAGASGFLAKPVDVEQLRAALGAIAHGLQAPGATDAPPRALEQALVSSRFVALGDSLPAGSLGGLVRQFFDDDARALADLRAAAATGSHEAVLGAAHKYKGSARMLGFDAVAAAAERLEGWSRAQGRPEDLCGLMAALAAALEATRREPAVSGDGPGLRREAAPA